MSDDRINGRLAALREEQQRGKEMLAQAEAQAAELRSTLLRIGGAIQVLEEILEDNDDREES